MTRLSAARRATRRGGARPDAARWRRPAASRSPFSPLPITPVRSAILVLLVAVTLVGGSAVTAASAMAAPSLTTLAPASALTLPGFDDVPQEAAPSQAAASEDDARAAYERAEALRVAGRCDEAIGAFGDVAVDHARTAWAGRAALGAARCLVSLGRPREAMPHLQRVRHYASELPAEDVQQALRWNTVLARLYLRAASDPLFTSGAPALAAATRLRDIVSLAALPGASATTGAATPRIAVLTESAYLLYEPDGRLTQSFTVQNPRGLLVDAAGEARVVTRNGAQTGRTGEPPLAWRAPRGSGTGAAQPLDDVTTACGVKGGEVIVADRRARTVQRFAADGRLIGPFVAGGGAVSRCAASARGDVALLDREGKTVTVLDAQGKTRYRLTARGEGYQLDAPIDIAFDVVGHLYVLDRLAATVWIFDPSGAPFGRLVSPAAGDNAFPEPTAFAVDELGHLWIYGDRLHRVVTWQ